MVGREAQFIIATHSPILMAYPGAAIYNFVEGRATPTPYDELEHVTVTRDFLNNLESFLRHLLG
jgi:predicted ATPase